MWLPTVLGLMTSVRYLERLRAFGEEREDLSFSLVSLRDRPGPGRVPVHRASRAATGGRAAALSREVARLKGLTR